MKLLESHFDYDAPGPFDSKNLQSAFPGSNVGFLAGKFDKICLWFSKKSCAGSIVIVEGQKALKIFYPSRRFGPLPGSQWYVDFKSAEKVFLEYKVFIPPDFDFVKGGKLPGLGGGKGNTGGTVPTGFDGWSVRFMFKEGGTICAYLYYPEMPDQFGEKVFLKSGRSRFILHKDQWMKIGLEVHLNTIGVKNGLMRCFVDGNLMLEKKGLVFRYHDNLKADHLLFSTFFGGGDSSYAPLKNCHLLFKDFIAEEMI